MNSSRGLVRSHRGEIDLSRDEEQEIDDTEIVGGEAARRKVLAFLEKTVGEVKVDTIHIQLFQYGFNADKPFKNWEVKVDQDFTDLAQDIVDVAETDITESQLKLARYGLLIAHHDGKTVFVLKVKQANDNARMTDMENLPVLERILETTVAQNQFMFEASLGSLAQQLKTANKMLQKANERIQWLETEHERTMEVREAINSEQHTRDMEWKRQEKADQMKSQVMSMGINAIGPIVNKIAQQKLLPQTASPLEQMMIGLAMTVDEKQLPKIIESGAFDIPQLKSLLTIIGEIHKSFNAGGTGVSVPEASAAPNGPSQNGKNQ